MPDYIFSSNLYGFKKLITESYCILRVISHQVGLVMMMMIIIINYTVSTDPPPSLSVSVSVSLFRPYRLSLLSGLLNSILRLRRMIVGSRPTLACLCVGFYRRASLMSFYRTPVCFVGCCLQEWPWSFYFLRCCNSSRTHELLANINFKQIYLTHWRDRIY